VAEHGDQRPPQKAAPTASLVSSLACCRALQVFVPGLFGNSDVGGGWPDGDGVYSLEGNTPYSTGDMVDFSNAFKVDALVFKQTRAQTSAHAKMNFKRTASCYANHSCQQFGKDVAGATNDGNTTSYGFTGPRARTMRPAEWLLTPLNASTAAEASAALARKVGYYWPFTATGGGTAKGGGELGSGDVGSGSGFGSSSGESGSGVSGSGRVVEDTTGAPAMAGQPLPTFKWRSAMDLGASELARKEAGLGLTSADWRSLREFSAGGFVAIFIPFFSDTYLPYERGPAGAVIDFRLHKATALNGRRARFSCARYTLDGAQVVQGCNRDPDRSDALVRQLMSQMVDELKRAHWIDAYTRMVSLHLQLRNENSGILFTVRYMCEFTAIRSMLPSFDIECLVTNVEQIVRMKLYLSFALAMTCWFCLLELVELTQAGLLEYICNGWNLLDWANFIIFFWAFQMWVRCIWLHESQLEREMAELDGMPFATCGSSTCDTIGYFDPYKKMYTAREARPSSPPGRARTTCTHATCAPCACQAHTTCMRSARRAAHRRASTRPCASTSSCSRSSSSPTSSCPRCR